MATTKTIRLRDDQADWLAVTAKRTQLSENRIIQALIDGAMTDTPPLTLNPAPLP